MTELTQLEQVLDASSIGKWKAYAAYKDSGVEWLGEIPEHWEVWRVKYAAPISTTKLDEKPLNAPYIGLENIESKTGRLLLDTPIENVDSAVGVFEKGNVLFGKLRPYLAKVACVEFPGVCTTELLVLQPAAFVSAKFLYYRLLSDDFIQLVNSMTYGTKMPRASGEQIGNLPIQLPSILEQRTIVAFLDRETSKLNTLIARKKRLIELLQEKRAALISHVVTKGLDPDVKMKDSGVEWLGEIPAHWEVRRLKFCLTSIEQGWSPPCENRPAEFEEWGVLKVGCVNGVDFNSDENKALPLELDPIPELEIKPGDVLMSRANTRELLGSASLVTQVRPRLLLCDKLYRLRLMAEVINSAYFVFAMGSHGVRFQMERDATGASNSMQNISQGTILNLIIPVPDITEQQAITVYVEREAARIDALISTIGEAIEKLREYSTALISAAVTGKIDVRSEVGITDGVDFQD
jgi:type I restriction enzyme S subunit